MEAGEAEGQGHSLCILTRSNGRMLQGGQVPLCSRVPLPLQESLSALRPDPGVQSQEDDRDPELLSSEGCDLYVVSHSCRHQREVLAGLLCVGSDRVMLFLDVHSIQT